MRCGVLIYYPVAAPLGNGESLRSLMRVSVSDFDETRILVRGLRAVCPVTLSRVDMQTCTILQPNVNRVQTWAVPLRREAKNVAIRDLIRERDQSTLQTAPVFKLEVFAAC